MNSSRLKPSILYSTPPSGNRIPVSRLAKAMRGLFINSGHELADPLSKTLGEKHIFKLSSGRAALWLILRAQSMLKPRKREVIIPAYTCPALASAILKAGLQPVLVDIDSNNFGLAREDLDKAMGHSTLAVIIVHLFGSPANLDEVYECCRENNAFLIEDSAQAFGNSKPDSPEEKLGLGADAGFFSFGRGKPLSVLHGGIAVTGSPDIFDCALRIFRDLEEPSMISAIKYMIILSSYMFFSHPRLYWIPERIPFLRLGETIFEPDFEIAKALRLPELILGEMSGLVKQEQVIRETNSIWYAEAFKDMAGIREPPVLPFPYLRYPLILERAGLRDRVMAELKRYGTGAALFYPSPLNELPVLRDILGDGRVYENAKRLSEQLITLPVHSGVAPRCLEAIKSIVINAANSLN